MSEPTIKSVINKIELVTENCYELYLCESEKYYINRYIF